MYIAGEYISNLCVRFLETVRNVRLCRAILVVSQRVQMNLIFSGIVQHVGEIKKMSEKLKKKVGVYTAKCPRKIEHGDLL